MTLRKIFILWLQKYNLYTVVRELYQQLNLERRHARKVNQDFYANLISSGDLCYDVGANVGQTIEALSKLKANIVAIEPNQHCLKVLHKRFGKRSNIEILDVALGATEGRGQLYCSGTDSRASLRKDWPFLSSDEIQDIKVTTLDQLIAKFGLPKLLKIDVEGFELEVVKGLSYAIPIIYFEMHGHEINLAKAFLERLSEIGSIKSINIVTADNSRWYFDDWVKYENFFARLPEPLPIRANIVVRME